MDVWINGITLQSAEEITIDWTRENGVMDWLTRIYASG
jgi:hypothetical protein